MEGFVRSRAFMMGSVKSARNGLAQPPIQCIHQKAEDLIFPTMDGAKEFIATCFPKTLHTTDFRASTENRGRQLQV